MRALLTCAAALTAALAATPAIAADRGASSLPTVHRGSAGDRPDWRRDDRRDGDFRRDRRDRDRDRRRDRFGSSSTIIYDREWDGGTAWRPDSFNDWWHESPGRNAPRWVAENRGCTQLWWSSEGWRC